MVSSLDSGQEALRDFGDRLLCLQGRSVLHYLPKAVGVHEGWHSVSPANSSSEELPPRIYRTGDPSPSNLRVRPGEESLSFRDSLSNPWPLTVGQRPVFRPGDKFFGIDTAKLPSGSVVVDNNLPGHVSVTGVDVQTLKDAIVERGKFPS